MNTRKLEASSTPVVDDNGASSIVVRANPDCIRAVIRQYRLEYLVPANWVIGNDVNCLMTAVIPCKQPHYVRLGYDRERAGADDQVYFFQTERWVIEINELGAVVGH